MNINNVIKLVGALGNEKLVIHSIVKEYGLDVLLKNADMLAVSNKTKHAIKQLSDILLGSGDLLVNVAGLTEIPKNKLLQYQNRNHNLSDLLEHLEKIDVDHWQFDKLRCLHDVIETYQHEQEPINKKNQDELWKDDIEP